MTKWYIISIIINVILGIISMPVFFIVRLLLWPGSWSWPSASSKEKLIGVIVLLVFAFVFYIVNKVIFNKNTTLNIKTYFASGILAFSLPILAITIFYKVFN